MNKAIILLFITLLLSGCATNKSPWEQYLDDYTVPRGLTGRMSGIVEIKEFAESIPVPLPKTTRYDNSQTDRSDYMQGFTEGWDFALNGNTSGLTNHQKEPSTAWYDGFEDGKRAYLEPMTKFLERLQKDMQNLHR